MEVTALPGYMPEGFVDDGEGKYFQEDLYGHGISIIPITTSNLAVMKEQMSFENVETVEEMMIQGMETHLILFQDAERYRSGANLFMFNPQEGYVLWLYGDYNVAKEELQKVAENLEISVKPMEETLSSIVAEEEKRVGMTS